MYAEIIGAIQSTKALGELVKAAKSLGNYGELVAAVSEVNTKLMDATALALSSQEEQSRLGHRIAELESQLKEHENWLREADRYELLELISHVFVYSLKPTSANNEPSHYICANCFTKKQKSILQLRTRNEYGSWYKCNNCNCETVAHTGYEGPTNYRSRDRL